MHGGDDRFVYVGSEDWDWDWVYIRFFGNGGYGFRRYRSNGYVQSLVKAASHDSHAD